MFDIRRATALRAVVQHGTISAAAASLHVTSSALSQQLAKLEREIGQPLLVRRGRGVEVTDAGELLAECTAGIVADIDRAEAALQEHQGQVMGRMTIAAFATAMRTIVSAALRTLPSTYPLLRVQSHEHEPADAIQLLAQGDIDVAIIDEWFQPRPGLPDGIEATHLLDDVADLALPADHRLATSNTPIDVGDCADEPWISWRAGEFGHDWLHRVLAGHHPDPHFAHTAGEHQTLLALVDAGLGIALMPRLGRGRVPANVVIKPLHPTITRHCFAIWRTDTTQRPAITAALDALTDAAAHLPQTHQ